MSLHHRCLTFVKQFLHVIYELRDFDAGLAMLSSDVSWVGIAKHEVCRDYHDALRLLSSTKLSPASGFVVHDTWLQPTLIDTHVCSVLGEFVVEESCSNAIVSRFEMRMSAICRLESDNDIKLTHVHFSLANNDGLPSALVQSYNLQLAQQLEERTRKLQENTVAMDSLLSNLTSSVVVCQLDGNQPIIYHNDSFCELVGYSHEELETLIGSQYLLLVAPEYVDGVLDSFQQQLSAGDRYQLEYPLLHRDGGRVWVMDKGSTIYNANGERLSQSVLTDMTIQKQLEYDLRKQNEVLTQNNHVHFEETANRNAIIDFVLTQSSVVYEVNLTTSEILSGTEQWESDFNIVPTGVYSQDIECFAYRAIHREDAGDFLRVFRHAAVLAAVADGKSDLCCEYRKLQGGVYRWHTFTLHVFIDDSTGDMRAVGYVQDINERKLQQLELIYNAEHDLLTGLYNKSHFGHLVDSYLAGEGKSGNHAFFILDIDHFKSINDSLGHSYGDVVLSRTATRTAELFRGQDLLGRVGGDEFAILMKNIGSTHTAESKASELCNKLHDVYSKNGLPLPVSVSVGVAHYPIHGLDYHELYAHSDIALYAAKDSGRNRSMVYCETLTVTPLQTTALDSDDLAPPHYFERNISDFIFRILYDNHDKCAAIHSVLELMGKQYGVSRSYIFEENSAGNGTNNTFEWCADGIDSHKDSLQEIAYTSIDEYPLNFNEAGIYYLADITSAAPNVRAMLELQGIVSMIQFSLMCNGEFYGFVGFDFCDRTVVPTKNDISVLKTVANMLGVFLSEMRAVELSDKMSNVAMSIVNSLDSYAYVIDPTTYRLLLTNSKTQLLSPTAIVGDYCYRSLMGLDAPCESCAMHLLGDKPDARVSVDIVNDNQVKVARSTASWLDWVDGSRTCLINYINL